MGVLKLVIEFIHEAACNKDFAEDNRIGKGGRGSPRENRDLELLKKLSNLFCVFQNSTFLDKLMIFLCKIMKSSRQILK